MGRKRTYDRKEIMQAICHRLTEGESLNAILKDKDMPSRVQIYNWFNEDAELLNNYVRAREEQADAIFDEMTSIILATPADKNEVAKSSLLINTLKWQLAKMNPKKYGERVTNEHTGEGGKAIEVVFKNMGQTSK